MHIYPSNHTLKPHIMTNYTVKFTGSKADKEAQGLKQVKSYLGNARFKALVGHLTTLKPKDRIRFARMAFMIAGVDSYWSLRGIVKFAGNQSK